MGPPFQNLLPVVPDSVIGFSGMFALNSEPQGGQAEYCSNPQPPKSTQVGSCKPTGRQFVLNCRGDHLHTIEQACPEKV